MKKLEHTILEGVFNTGLLAFLVIGILVLPGAVAVNAFANSRIVLEDDFEGTTEFLTSQGEELIVLPEGGTAWTSPVSGDSKDVKQSHFLVFDSTRLNPSEGTIAFRIKRDNKQDYENMFSFTDDQYNNIFNVIFDWEYNRFSTGLENPDDSAWRMKQTWDLPAYRDRYSNVYPLPGVVKQGQWVHLAFTWGPEPGDTTIFVDGERLSIELDRPSTIPSMIARSTYLVFGALPEGKGTDEVWSMMTSAIDDIEVYDTALNPLVPVIESVSHDAFEVAGYSGDLVAGDEITVTIQAESGGVAAFDLGGVIDHDMTEVEQGVYKGSHIIDPGEDVEEGQILGKFVSSRGLQAQPVTAERPVTINTSISLKVNANNSLIPADKSSRSGLTINANDANGKAIQGHELILTLSTTEEYTGIAGGGSFEDQVGGTIDVDWGGITDSFGEVTAQYLSGFAAKTILVSAKDMVTGDAGVGWVRAYIDGSVDILVTQPKATALAVSGRMDVSLSREWLTADGKSRSRITAMIRDASGKPVSGHSVGFTLLGTNGQIRIVQGKTDSAGRAFADYIAGTVMGQVQVEVRDLTSGLVTIVPIELRPDAPAEIALTTEPGEIVTGGEAIVMARVTDANGNPNSNVDVLYVVVAGAGSVGANSVATDGKGIAPVVFTAGNKAGLVTVRGTVISREPTAEEISAAEGAVFLYGLEEDPGRLEVVEWFVTPGDEVAQGQDLAALESRSGRIYTVKAPRDGIVATFIAEERDRVEYGDTLGYVLEIPE